VSSKILSRNLKIQTIPKPILSHVVYGYGTSDLTLHGEYWIRVFKNRELRELFDSKREEVSGRKIVQ
jgi:hypothetical protein